MFKDVVRNTAMTTESANDFFYGRIVGDTLENDCSFVSTLRALLCNRIQGGEVVRFSVYSAHKTAYFYNTHNGVDAVRSTVGIFYDEDFRANRIYYHRITSESPEGRLAALRCFENSFTQAYTGWERVERVTDFFVKKIRVLCFINRNLKSVYLVTGPINMRMYHYIQCGIFAMLPWYFDREKGVTQEEMDIINSLRENDSSKYLTAIEAIAKKFDFRAKRIRELLYGFESQAFKQQLERNSDEIDNIRNLIADYYRAAREQLAKKEELELRSVGLMAKINESGDSSEYMDYFLANKNLSLIDCTGAQVSLIAKGYIMFYDEEMAEDMINNVYGAMYTGDMRHSTEHMRKLWIAVFVDKKIKMKVCAYYSLSRTGVIVRQDYRFGPDYDDCTPNPHIDRYTCLGSYEEAINTLLNEGDYIGATEQCLASCQSLNFADYYVIKEFALRMNEEDRVNVRCFELPDGRVVGPGDAIEWLLDEEKKSQEEQNG